MRFALAGCGVIAPKQVRALQVLSGRVELVSCSDVVPERADTLADGEMVVGYKDTDHALRSPF